MESQPQNPEFRINPENLHPWKFCNENNGHQYRVQTCFFMYFHGLTERLPVSGTSVGLIILLICSMDCKSGDNPVKHITKDLHF